jgi:hypothetical protein
LARNLTRHGIEEIGGHLGGKDFLEQNGGNVRYIDRNERSWFKGAEVAGR